VNQLSVPCKENGSWEGDTKAVSKSKKPRQEGSTEEREVRRSEGGHVQNKRDKPRRGDPCQRWERGRQKHTGLGGGSPYGPGGARTRRGLVAGGLFEEQKIPSRNT